MTSIHVRSLPAVGEREIEQLSDVLIDCVEGGASVSFMLLYARLGWQRCGIVPDYALLPGGGFCDTTFFYRALQP
jgi:hypothetical protein